MTVTKHLVSLLKPGKNKNGVNWTQEQVDTVYAILRAKLNKENKLYVHDKPTTLVSIGFTDIPNGDVTNIDENKI
jgi:hypothetical protein